MVHAMGKESAARVTLRTVADLERSRLTCRRWLMTLATTRPSAALETAEREQRRCAGWAQDQGIVEKALQDALDDIRADPSRGLESRLGSVHQDGVGDGSAEVAGEMGEVVAGAWGLVSLALGGGVVWVTPFDVVALPWNLFSYRFICSAPVRGGTHFLCCCKESKQRKQLSTASPNRVHSRLKRSGSTGGVSLAGFHRCWHVDKARASHRDREWISSHSSVLALRARRQVCQAVVKLKHAASTNVASSDGFRFCLTGERVARGWMNDCWSTSYSGATRVPFLDANNDETPLTTLPRLDHSDGTVWRRMARIGVGKLLSLLTFFAAAKKVSPAPDRGRANKPKTKQVP